MSYFSVNHVISFRVPAPLHTTDIASHQIPLEFPSNHPYTSHISEKAVFPTSTDGLNDRPSTSIDPYIVTHKIRGKEKKNAKYIFLASFSKIIGNTIDIFFFFLSLSQSTYCLLLVVID